MDLCAACGKEDTSSFWIGCDGGCNAWYHGICVGISKQYADKLSTWKCKRCSYKDVSTCTDFDEPRMFTVICVCLKATNSKERNVVSCQRCCQWLHNRCIRFMEVDGSVLCPNCAKDSFEPLSVQNQGTQTDAFFSKSQETQTGALCIESQGTQTSPLLVQSQETQGTQTSPLIVQSQETQTSAMAPTSPMPLKLMQSAQTQTGLEIMLSGGKNGIKTVEVFDRREKEPLPKKKRLSLTQPNYKYSVEGFHNYSSKASSKPFHLKKKSLSESQPKKVCQVKRNDSGVPKENDPQAKYDSDDDFDDAFHKKKLRASLH